MSRRTGPPEPSDRDAGVWAGRSVARRFVSPDGFVVLVGRTAADNDVLTFKIGAPRDLIRRAPHREPARYRRSVVPDLKIRK